MNTAYQFNPGLDLTFERIVDVPKEFNWRAWARRSINWLRLPRKYKGKCKGKM